MGTPLVIIGCGGFGREVQDVVDAVNDTTETWDLLGYLDDAPDPEKVRLVESRGSRILGGTSWLETADAEVHYVIGIGNGSVRRALDQRYTSIGVNAATVIHPSSTVGHDVRIGSGSVLCAGVRVTTNIDIGRHVHLNLNATVGHDARISDYVTVNPLVAISGGVRVGAESMLGTHSAVLQYLSVGSGSVVGAGSCVVRDVPDGVVVKGVPAR